MPCVDRLSVLRKTERSVCREGNLDASKLHEVVLVGGCAHIPRLQTAFKAALGKAPTIAKEKDSAARGAAVQARHVQRHSTKNTYKDLQRPVTSCLCYAAAWHQQCMPV